MPPEANRREGGSITRVGTAPQHRVLIASRNIAAGEEQGTSQQGLHATYLAEALRVTSGLPPPLKGNDFFSHLLLADYFKCFYEA
jgi:hypothetical protein